MMGYGYGGMEWMWVPMLFWTVLAIAGLVVLTLVIGRLLRDGSGQMRGPSSPSGTARAILDERYARGEIEEDEYRRRRETME